MRLGAEVNRVKTQRSSEKSSFLSIAIVIVTASIFGLTYSLTAPLVAQILMKSGLTETLVGANAAMHALGVLCIAPFLSGLAIRYKPEHLIMTALLSSALLLILFPLVPNIWLWFPLRFLLGVSAEILFVLTETWTSELSNDKNRGRIMATYTASLSLGFAGGPLILSFTGFEGLVPFAIGAVVALLAFVIMSLPGLRQLEMAQHKSSHFLRMIRLSPIAMGTTAINSAVETAGLSFLAIYATRLGWNETEGAQLITVLMVGAIALQLPIGWLSDKMNRATLMIALTAVSAITAFLWPLLLSAGWLAYPALFIWGGIFVGIYTTMLAIIGSQFRGSDLISVYAAMGLFWGGGALLGPMLAGGFLDLMQHGLPIFVGMACAVFMMFALIVKRSLKPSGDPQT
ncbi:MFS transporter [Ochrobactrum chromiisoli]|uniref:MFS transporter n=1 Tax=Ochrobactrum chromiisoli TaxID=2993941 RepID=A0ABT3QV76_9HYPH|nr:MFS transporter [Ochrobactrum chromiisoli]MCX2699452.1 MFS transporter [Ochrobactrum chromiisoli]